jgi:hypothetical protein
VQSTFICWILLACRPLNLGDDAASVVDHGVLLDMFLPLAPTRHPAADAPLLYQPFCISLSFPAYRFVGPAHYLNVPYVLHIFIQVVQFPRFVRARTCSGHPRKPAGLLQPDREEGSLTAPPLPYVRAWLQSY